MYIYGRYSDLQTVHNLHATSPPHLRNLSRRLLFKVQLYCIAISLRSDKAIFLGQLVSWLVSLQHLQVVVNHPSNKTDSSNQARGKDIYLPFSLHSFLKKKETRKMMRQSYCLSVGGCVCQVYIPTSELTEFHATYAVIMKQPTVALSNFLELVRIPLLTREI
jgi:hypothetical protein